MSAQAAESTILFVSPGSIVTGPLGFLSILQITTTPLTAGMKATDTQPRSITCSQIFFNQAKYVVGVCWFFIKSIHSSHLHCLHPFVKSLRGTNIAEDSARAGSAW